MKHKVDDKVKIRKDLNPGCWYGADAFLDPMKKFLGTEQTISEVTEVGTYRFQGDPDGWGWTDEMFEPAEAVNHPAHYNAPGRRECINEMLEKFGPEKVRAFCELNAYKYRYRHEWKNGEEDLRKAEWYENKMKEYDSMGDSKHELERLFPDYAYPPLDISCGMQELFKRYGETITGICDGWFWDEEELKKASDADKWKMVAVASAYWEKWYEESYDEGKRREADLRKQVKALTERSDGWIPTSIKHRLPVESDGTVLVCMPDIFPYNQKESFVNAEHDRRIQTATRSQFSGNWYDSFGGRLPDAPIAWRPLPEAPEVAK